MLVYQSPADRPRTPSALAIGSFDGLHVGHQALLRRLRAVAAELHVPSVVYTFDLPTRVLLQGTRFLYTLAEKLKILESLLVDEVVAVPFTREFSLRPPEAFLGDLRVLQPLAVVVGDDFRFGHGRAGGLDELRGVTERVEVLAMQEVGGEPVHASRIRSALEEGDVERARRLLGRPFTARGVVVHGDARGRTIGVPTANVALSDGKLRPPGVFAVRMLLPDGRFEDGMANVGKRPTVGGLEERLEVNLLDLDEDLYGLEVRVDFLRRIREERRFDGLAALIEQLGRDRDRARELLADDPWGRAPADRA